MPAQHANRTDARSVQTCAHVHHVCVNECACLVQGKCTLVCMYIHTDMRHLHEGVCMYTPHVNTTCAWRWSVCTAQPTPFLSNSVSATGGNKVSRASLGCGEARIRSAPGHSRAPLSLICRPMGSSSFSGDQDPRVGWRGQRAREG